jgi:hypothetical protein
MATSAIRVAFGAFDIVDTSTMDVSTSIIGSTGFNVVATSEMVVDTIRRQPGAIAFTESSSMTVNARLKWEDENDTAETWTGISDNSETWTQISDQSETWTAISDSSETWTPIADNSESWQIAA